MDNHTPMSSTWKAFRDVSAPRARNSAPTTSAPQGFAETGEWKPRHPFTFTGVYDWLSTLEKRVDDHENVVGMLNDGLGDVMGEQADQTGDLAELNETARLVWEQIGKIYTDLDTLYDITLRQERIIMALVITLTFVVTVSVTSLVWIWKMM